MRRAGRKIVLLLLAVVLFSGFCSCTEERKEEVETLRIGVASYRQDDTFIASLCADLEKIGRLKEKETGKKIIIKIEDAKGNQSTQNDQVDKMIAQQYDILCINPVDRTVSSLLIDKARKANIPIIFFNREPVEEDIYMWSSCYYVGTDAEQSGVMQGQIIVDAYQKDPKKIDKNGDGVIQYVMLEGEQAHQDSLIRTDSSIKTVMNSGIKVEKLANATANWQRTQGMSKMSQWIEQYGDKIEVVFGNNDDMALGAIDAYRALGWKDLPVIVGIDGTLPCLQEMRNGAMFGSVVNDAYKQAEAIFNLSYALLTGESALGAVDLENYHYVWIPHRIVTRDNVEEELYYLQN